jgi:hypothetical protein
MSESSNLERGLVGASPVRRLDGGVNAWLVELGALVRNAEARAKLEREQGHRLRAWSSRRAGSRSRRLIVQHALATSAIAIEPGPAVETIERAIPALPPLLVEAPRPEAVREPEPVFVPAVELEEPERKDARRHASPLLVRIGAYTDTR